MFSSVFRSLPLLFLLTSIPFLQERCPDAADPSQLRISGQVEVDRVRVAPLVAGRILELNLPEGTVLEKDALVARLDCEELENQLKQAEAAARGAEAHARLVSRGARREDIAQARELVNSAQAQLEAATTDLRSARKLWQDQYIPQRDFDNLKSRRDAAQAQVAASQQQYRKLVAGARLEEVEAARAQADQADAAVAGLKLRLTRCTVKAPLTGTVVERLVEPGEVAGVGVPLGVLADLRQVRVRGYVTEQELGHVKLGSAAQVFIDSNPTQPMPAKVARVATEAEFTPRNVQTRNERVKTMYAVEVTVDNAAGSLKEGMPADVVLQK